MKCRALIMTLCVLFYEQSFAGWGANINAFYLTDNFVQSSTSSQSKSYYSAELFHSFEKLKSVYFGFDVVGLAQNDVAGATTTNFSASDYGLIAQAEIGGGHNWTVALAYHPSSSATYDSTGSTQKLWKGSSYLGRIGYQVGLKSGFAIGASLIYYNADYTTEESAGATQSISRSRNWVLPVLSVSFWK